LAFSRIALGAVLGYSDKQMNLFKPFVELLENILAGTRAALFMPFHLWLFKGGFVQICLLMFVSLGLSLVYDYYDTAPDNYFNPYGLSYQALLYLSFFFSLSLIAYLNSRQKDFPRLVIVFLSVVPVIWLGSVCLLALANTQTFLDEYQANWAVFGLYSLWYLLVVFRLIKRFFYFRFLAAIAYVILYAVINFSPLFLLPTEPLWYPKQKEIDISKNQQIIDIEKIYYSQNNLLAKAVDDLVDSRDGVTDLFFIGFAGDANEDVFMNEAIAARDIISNNFNAFGRSLVLINNKKTVDHIPLANSHNLKNGIKEIAKHMNLDEDILLIFLTSHGSEDHTISANFPPFKLNDINANTVSRALNSSGVKWRIIIISACYSGGLIDALADEYTLLITAASPDRHSFGCGHDGNYTYFGEAYFESGLKNTKSFIKAFGDAKKIIREMEQEAGIKNSNPQIRIGSEMENKLTEYEKRIAEKRNTNWASTINN
jgi:Peptidase C13 family